MLNFFVCRPAITVLLMSMVNEKQSFVLRCSVLYCFQCFLFKNEVGQSQLVQTLLPSSTEGMKHFGNGGCRQIAVSGICALQQDLRTDSQICF